MALSYKFLQEVPSKLEMQCKRSMYFDLILVGTVSFLILPIKNLGWVAFFLLNGQNPLSVMKVIC